MNQTPETTPMASADPVEGHASTAPSPSSTRKPWRARAAAARFGWAPVAAAAALGVVVGVVVTAAVTQSGDDTPSTGRHGARDGAGPEAERRVGPEHGQRGSFGRGQHETDRGGRGGRGVAPGQQASTAPGSPSASPDAGQDPSDGADASSQEKAS